jgi:phosphoenolpyruvate-protein phosphotransferase (PTS system enzyme I)
MFLKIVLENSYIMRSQRKEAFIQGVPISRGIAIGTLFFLCHEKIDVPSWNVAPSKINDEIDRYRLAISRSKQDLKRLKKQLETEDATEGVAILNTQLEILQDPVITLEVEKRIRDDLKNAEHALLRIIEKCEVKFKAIKDPYFLEKLNDLKDLSRRVINHLNESRGLSLPELPPQSIVCTKELSTSDVAEASPRTVNAFITEWGGATSHTAIMAKSKGIPYVSNIDLNQLKEKANGTVIVDGRSGKVIINPSERTLNLYRGLYDEMNKQALNIHLMSKRAAETLMVLMFG